MGATACCIEAEISRVLDQSLHTGNIMDFGKTKVSGSAMGVAVLANI